MKHNFKFNQFDPSVSLAIFLLENKSRPISIPILFSKRVPSIVTASKNIRNMPTLLILPSNIYVRMYLSLLCMQVLYP